MNKKFYYSNCFFFEISRRLSISRRKLILHPFVYYQLLRIYYLTAVYQFSGNSTNRYMKMKTINSGDVTLDCQSWTFIFHAYHDYFR